MTRNSRVSRRRFMGGACIGAGMIMATPAMSALPAATRRPNILFIMADDLGSADLSCYGRRDYQTPNLDRLASQGVKLFQGYANSPVCSASRTALLTGRYQYRYASGLNEPSGDGPEIGLPADTPTLPLLLRSLGYRTSLIGKWHLGEPPKHGPRSHGYDSFYGVLSGGTDYFKYASTESASARLTDNGRPVESERYLTDLLGERARKEIADFARGDRPFYMSLHFTAPHWPWEGPNDRARADAVSDVFDKDGGSLATYGEMVRSLDNAVGSVLEQLEMSGLADNTIVVFTSDNGGERFSDSWPYVGVKTELLEGGLRVPLLMRWPGHIAPGTTSEQPMMSMDFLPTLLGAAGHGAPDSLALDGMNLLPVLLGREPVRPRKLFWRYKAHQQAAVRDGRWKYLRRDGKEHLFDLDVDVRERAEQKDRHPEIFERLRGEWEAWNKDMLPYPEDSYSHDMSEMLVDR